MHTDFIDNTNPLYLDVVALGKKHSKFLGFMPDGGFKDHAQKNCIIIAHKDHELYGYLMFREVPRDSRVSVVHLCVDEKFRGQNITTQLLNVLRSKYKRVYSGISLKCRDDYEEASRVWENYGFIAKSKSRSRSFDEHYLTTWWYDFNTADLFTFAACNSTKVKALLDVNIIIKLRESRTDYSPSEDPRGLLADWLIEETEFYFASETYNEINRDADLQRAKNTRNFLGHFTEAKYDFERQKEIAKELRLIIGGSSDNDQSDRKQLATCIVSYIRYFITLDAGIIDKKKEIELQYDIQIFTPQEFIIEIDQLLNEEAYSPFSLKGVVCHSISRVRREELQNFIGVFNENGLKEKKSSFNNIVAHAVSKMKAGEIKVIKREESPLAFFAYEYGSEDFIIHFLRLTKQRHCRTLFMQLVADFILKAIDQKKVKINLNEVYLTEEQKIVLRKMGFDPHSATSWVKYISDKIASKLSLQSILSEVDKSYADIDCSVMEDNRLLEIERKFFPLKICDIDIPCYIIPIKSVWAGELFDFKISGSTLFGAKLDLLWNIENVYYRRAKPITEKAPARILWYVSKDIHTCRSGAIVATSYLDAVMTDSPKHLFHNHKHYGVYEWEDICKLCEPNMEQDIRVLKFSNTEVFEHPVTYSEIQTILQNNEKRKNTFASPVKMSKEIFEQIYKLAKWGK